MAVKASMGDMHLMLMEQLQRLNEVDGDELKGEIARAEAMAALGKTVVSNAALMIKASKLAKTCEAPKVLVSGDVDVD